MKPILPEERREWARYAKELDCIVSDITWTFVERAQENLTLAFQNHTAMILIYTFPREPGMHYISATARHTVSPVKFAEFSGRLLSKILQTEGAIHDKSDLETAIGAINTMLRREDFLAGPSDPCDWWFPTQYNRIRAAHKKHKKILPGFPIKIFEQQDYFAPKEILETAKKMIDAAAEKYSGQTVCIENMRQLTAGFCTQDRSVLLFDPIATYHTNDETSNRFKAQLREYAQGNRI